MIKYTFKGVVSLIRVLNTTSLKRVVVYFVLLYPLVFIYLNRDELKVFLRNNTTTSVVIKDLSVAQERCYSLRQKYNAESVLLYAYQPIGHDKTYKERLVFSTNNYMPLENMRIINLFSKTRIIEALRKNGYAIINADSNHSESSIIKAFNLKEAVVIPIKKRESKELIGEVVWLFNDTENLDIHSLIIESQMFSYDLEY